MSRISPIILLVIVIIAIGFFVLGLLQLLIRCLMKRPSFSSLSHSTRLPDSSTPHTFQRQLQHLFRLHDSGLDQAVIDALPVFYYKEIIGLKEPFDCAVCLSEFSHGDKLKFLPNCSHAFHIHCIETWLLSNSTCPLCRNVITSGNPMLLTFDDSVEQQENSVCPNESSYDGGPTRVLSVRLGKLRSSNKVQESEVREQNGEGISGSIDGRRCYSMGAFRYVVCDDNLRVALCGGNRVDVREKERCGKEERSSDMELDGKRIHNRSRGDSFSVSKIWLWSKKGKFLSSSDVNGSSVLPNGGSLV